MALRILMQHQTVRMRCSIVSLPDCILVTAVFDGKQNGLVGLFACLLVIMEWKAVIFVSLGKY